MAAGVAAPLAGVARAPGAKTAVTHGKPPRNRLSLAGQRCRLAELLERFQRRGVSLVSVAEFLYNAGNIVLDSRTRLGGYVRSTRIERQIRHRSKRGGTFDVQNDRIGKMPVSTREPFILEGDYSGCMLDPLMFNPTLFG